MSAFGGPNIIEDGLVLYLDAGNRKSYPGSGTTWFDKSGRGNNGTLINGPTFNTGELGSVVFDGVNDFVKPNSSSILEFTDFTLSSWIKLSSLNLNQFIIDTSTNNNFGLGYSYRITTSNRVRFWAYNADNFLDSTATVSSNIWCNVVSTYNNTPKLQTIYINGLFDISNTHSNSFVISNTANLRIGSSQILGGYITGDIALIQMYNRALSAQEILQNYNATKGRFGL